MNRAQIRDHLRRMKLDHRVWYLTLTDRNIWLLGLYWERMWQEQVG